MNTPNSALQRILWDSGAQEWYWQENSRTCEVQPAPPDNPLGTAKSLHIPEPGEDTTTWDPKYDKPSTLTSVSSIKCHTGPCHILTFAKNTKLYVGSYSEILNRAWDFRIALGELDRDWMPQPTGEVVFENMDALLSPEQIARLSVRRAERVIGIAWRDYGVPDVPRTFWDALLDTLCDFPNGSVGMNCMGGHGRTGTALAILVYLSGVDTTDPVKWVRDYYCRETIESYPQIAYIEQICGTKFPNAKPRATKPSYTSHQGSGGSSALLPFHYKATGHKTKAKQPPQPQPTPNPGESPAQAKRRRRAEKRARRQKRLQLKLQLEPKV